MMRRIGLLATHFNGRVMWPFEKVLFAKFISDYLQLLQALQMVELVCSDRSDGVALQFPGNATSNHYNVQPAGSFRWMGWK